MVRIKSMRQGGGRSSKNVPFNGVDSCPDFRGNEREHTVRNRCFFSFPGVRNLYPEVGPSILCLFLGPAGVPDIGTLL